MNEHQILVWEEWTCPKCDETHLLKRQDNDKPLTNQECEACGYVDEETETTDTY